MKLKKLRKNPDPEYYNKEVKRLKVVRKTYNENLMSVCPCIVAYA